jgi:hypothetical protein
MYIFSEYFQHNLLALLRFNHHLLEATLLGTRLPPETVSDLRLRFLFYQLLRLLRFYHQRGLFLGNLSTRTVYITEMLWLHVVPVITPSVARVVGPQPPEPPQHAQGLKSRPQCLCPPPVRPPGCVSEGFAAGPECRCPLSPPLRLMRFAGTTRR